MTQRWHDWMIALPRRSRREMIAFRTTSRRLPGWGGDRNFAAWASTSYSWINHHRFVLCPFCRPHHHHHHHHHHHLGDHTLPFFVPLFRVWRNHPPLHSVFCNTPRPWRQRPRTVTNPPERGNRWMLGNQRAISPNSQILTYSTIFNQFMGSPIHQSNIKLCGKHQGIGGTWMLEPCFRFVEWIHDFQVTVLFADSFSTSCHVYIEECNLQKCESTPQGIECWWIFNDVSCKAPNCRKGEYQEYFCWMDGTSREPQNESYFVF